MKTIVDYKPFNECAILLSELTNERDQLQIEQIALHKQLLPTASPQLESLTTEELAKRLANGGDIPANAIDQMGKTRDRELAVRVRLEALNRVLYDLPQLLEHRRSQGRDAALEEMAGDLEKVRADFERAKKSMVAAMLAENRLIDRLVVGGFGGTDPWLTAPHWIDRSRMLELEA